jgi:hypothetical protein
MKHGVLRVTLGTLGTLDTPNLKCDKYRKIIYER